MCVVGRSPSDTSRRPETAGFSEARPLQAVLAECCRRAGNRRAEGGLYVLVLKKEKGHTGPLVTVNLLIFDPLKVNAVFIFLSAPFDAVKPHKNAGTNFNDQFDIWKSGKAHSIKQ
jgi:hypothetical protein